MIKNNWKTSLPW